MDYIKNPNQIERRSFEIITKEAGTSLDRFSEEEKLVVKRVIHTTADFEYADLMDFHPKALEVAKASLKKGHNIYADTSMIMTGLRRRDLKTLGVEVLNFVHDEDVYAVAKQQGITRSMAGIKKAINDDRIRIFMIGNAPTAIFQLKELLEAGHPKPDLIIGVPVGFVGAIESKEVLDQMNVPYIRVTGRKGGSTVAVAILNAVLKIMNE